MKFAARDRFKDPWLTESAGFATALAMELHRKGGLFFEGQKLFHFEIRIKRGGIKSLFGVKELVLKKIWFGLLVAAVLIAAAFLLLNFRWMSSQTQSQSAVATGGKKSFQEQGKFTPDATGLYVEGDFAFTQDFQAKLQKAIEHQLYVGKVTTINLPADRFDLPALAVKIIPIQYSWTPIHASAEYKIVVSYASNGDISFRNQPAVHFQLVGEPAIQFSATLTWSDQSRGIISAPAYQSYLIEQWVQAIQDVLRKQIEG